MAKKKIWKTPEERAAWEAEYQRSQRDLAERVAELESLTRPPDEREQYYAKRLAEFERLYDLAPAGS